MTAKHTALIVVLVAIVGTFLPFYLKELIIPYSGVLQSILQHPSLPQISHWFNSPSQTSDRLFTSAELSLYNGGKDSPGLYLSILGRVYDVEKGIKHYGSGGNYHGFTGRDASASFATGDFSEDGLKKNVLSLSDSDIKVIWDWIALYDREYEYKGKLIGQFYNDNGEPTLDYESVVEIVERIENANKSKKADMIRYPPCNMEWSASAGSRVWCSKCSGGIERDWVGVPRKYYEPGSESYRCACVPLSVIHSSPNGLLQEYDSCRPNAESCYVKQDS